MDKKCKDLEQEKQMSEAMNKELVEKMEQEIEELKRQLTEKNHFVPSEASQDVQHQLQHQIQTAPFPSSLPSMSASAPSNNSRASSHPYAYDMPDDRPIEIPGSIDRSLSIFNGPVPSLLGTSVRQNEFDGTDVGEQGIDLMTLAGMNDSKLMMPAYYSDNNLNVPSFHHDSHHTPQVGPGAVQSYQNHQRLGSSNEGPNGRDPFSFQTSSNFSNHGDQNAKKWNGHPSTSAVSALTAVGGPKTMTMGSNTVRPTPLHPQQNPGSDFTRTPGNRFSSPRPSDNQQAPTPQLLYDNNHPLRNHLRDTKKGSKGSYPNIFNVPSAYATVKPTMSTQPIRGGIIKTGTTIMENGTLHNTINRRSESPRENQVANVTGMYTPARAPASPSPVHFMQSTSSRKGKEKIPTVATDIRPMANYRR